MYKADEYASDDTSTIFLSYISRRGECGCCLLLIVEIKDFFLLCLSLLLFYFAVFYCFCVIKTQIIGLEHIGDTQPYL